MLWGGEVIADALVGGTPGDGSLSEELEQEIDAKQSAETNTITYKCWENNQ
jgi:hypothetical protein